MVTKVSELETLTEGGRILEFGDALDMVTCNTMFKKMLSRLITCESGGIKSQIDYFLQ